MLVDAAKKDVEHFGKLYDKYFNAIFQYVFRRTEDEDATADITSQTFLKALQNLKKYEYRGLPFSAWLFRIATNEINRYFRKTKKTSLFSIEESRIRDLVAETGDDHIDDKVRSLINVLKEAPTQLVEILELRFFEERGFQEISYILNISESAAKMRTYRALDKLREIMVIKLRDNEQA